MPADDARQLFLSDTAHAELELLRSLGALADELGVAACVVGGVVRDLLLGLPNCDLDIVVEGDAVAFAEAAAGRLGGSVKAHTRFGTVILTLPGGLKVDLATARSEVYERSGALPTVTPGEMENDLRRRDFTVNSMAIVLNADGFGRLLDPFDGRADLENGVLRVLTDASFEDDPTRVLRGVRFSARFGLTIETGTEALLKRAVSERRTDTVSGERLLNELELILREDDPWPPVSRLIDWGILSSMVEGWEVPRSIRTTIVEVDRLLYARRETPDPAPERWVTLFGALIQPLAPDVRSRVVERLSAGRRVRTLASELTDLEQEALPFLSADDDLRPSHIHRLLSRFGDETLLLARAAAPGTVVAERVALHADHLAGTRTALTGGDLAELGVPEGKAVGNILSTLLDARLDGEVSSADEERALARRLAETLTQETGTDSVSDYPTTGDQDPEASTMANEELLEEQTAAETPPAAAAPDTRARFRQEASLVNRPVYEVRLDAFEGPLDLLLHLIREHEIDIYDIPIATITQQYLDYINFMESLDLSLAGEFLEMAATLIRIKVQMLLPKETEGDEDEEDPREQLVRKLVEYKQFKEVAATLSSKEEDRRKHFPRGVDPKSYADVEEEVDIEEFLRDVTLFDLVDGLREVLSRVPDRVDVHSVDMDEFTVEEQIERIRAIIAERRSIPFADAFGAAATRIKIIATFIALLELIRLGEVRAIQTRNFGDIEIEARVEE